LSKVAKIRYFCQYEERKKVIIVPQIFTSIHKILHI
jgi:hypothetical protein